MLCGYRIQEPEWDREEAEPVGKRESFPAAAF